MSLAVYAAAFDTLRFSLLTDQTPRFFSAVRALERAPAPLFTFEPVYGLYAKKTLTPHYYVADL